ncbi:MAG: hypothetical protein ACLFO1_08305 [Spirochaetaceae bacterium]
MYVSVWTDRPEVAAYLEQYNAGQARFRAGVELVDSVADSLQQRDDHPDLVVGSFLANETTLPLMRDLSRTLDGVGAENFYASLLEFGTVDGEVRLLPVSFNLPTVMFAANSDNAELPEFALSLEQIRDAGGAFNAREDESYVRMGFSPRWNGAFLYTVARLYGVAFHEGEERFATWDHGALSSTVSFLRDWTETTNGGITAEDSFERQYLYDPPYQLLRRGRIRFSFVGSNAYFGFTDGERSALEFRWVSNDSKVPIEEDLVLLGIPAESANPAGARDLVKWFYEAETQEDLLRMVVSKQLSTFGIAGGFSAFPEVNELVFPRVYPALLGRIPPESRLTPPRLVPKNWGEIKEDVVYPWFASAVSDGTSQDALERRIRSWVLQKGE